MLDNVMIGNKNADKQTRQYSVGVFLEVIASLEVTFLSESHGVTFLISESSFLDSIWVSGSHKKFVNSKILIE